MAYVREPVSFQINMQQKDNVSGKIDGIVPRPCALSDLEMGFGRMCCRLMLIMSGGYSENLQRTHLKYEENKKSRSEDEGHESFAMDCRRSKHVSLLSETLSWSLGMFGTAEDPRVTEIKNLQQDLAKKFKPTQGPASASDAVERVTAITTVMTKVAALPEDLRSEAMQPGKKMMMESMEATVNNYFELPQSEREAYLDNQIRQMEFMRQAFEAGKSVMGAIGWSKKKARCRLFKNFYCYKKIMVRKRRASVDEKIVQRMSGMPGERKMIDRTTPEQRAKFGEYFSAMKRRREELGLPSWGSK